MRNPVKADRCLHPGHTLSSECNYLEGLHPYQSDPGLPHDSSEQEGIAGMTLLTGCACVNLACYHPLYSKSCRTLNRCIRGKRRRCSRFSVINLRFTIALVCDTAINLKTPGEKLAKP